MNSSPRQVLAVITARGGSKGLPRKNVLPLAGRPLINWTIEAAQQAQCIGRVVVSTDDPEIATVARAAGADVPFVRPSELATDTATSLDVLRHACDMCSGYPFLMLLQPTSPLRTAGDIDSAYELMRQRSATSCVTVCEVEESPWLMFRQRSDSVLEPLLAEVLGSSRRQDLPKVYRLNGAVYVVETEWFRRSRKLIDSGTIGCVMPRDRSVDIDSAEDFAEAARLISASRPSLTDTTASLLRD